MIVTKSKFGEVDGQTVTAYTLKNSNGLEVTCLDYGCVITKIMVPDSRGNVENIVLGFDNMADYLKHSPYFGAVVGRVAGRIRGAEFDLNGKTHRLAKNEGDNHLHGGSKGFSHVLWHAKTSENDGSSSVEFFYISPDGEEGYPGNLEMKVTYTLNDDNQFIIHYEGVSDKDTLLNVTNHTYFNLSGNLKRDILNHTLKMKSDRFLELDETFLPTGDCLDVTGTPFDFRKGRKMIDGTQSSHKQNVLVGKGYDHPFMLSSNHQQEMILSDDESGRSVIVETDEPCVILYSSNSLDEGYSIQGVPSRKYLGLCLETQAPPDAVHHPEFPSCILKKGQIFRSTTKYTFL